MEGELLQEYEALEILLFNAIPRKDTNPLAHRLLAKFGTMDKVLSADISQLMEVDGVGQSIASYLVSIGVFLRNYMKRSPLGKIGQFDSNTFISYIKEKYKGLKTEILDVYFIDSNNGLSLAKTFTSFEEKRIVIEPADFSELFLDERMQGVVLVHNHPTGVADSSEMDDDMTKQCQILCSYHNKIFCDHFIYANEGIYSYYMSGRLAKISREYSLMNILGKLDKKKDKI